MAGGRGRKKPKVLDLLEGGPGHREILEGVESTGQPFIMEHLHEDAKQCVRCIRLSMPPQIYGALDSYLLSAFGQAWAVHKAASTVIAQPEFSLLSKRGQISRWLIILEKAASQMAVLSSKLGLDPISRQSLKLPQYRADQSKFAGLIGQTRSSATLNVLESLAERVRADRSDSENGKNSSSETYTSHTTEFPAVD